MTHMLGEMVWFGNIRRYANWADESDNKTLKVACKKVSQQTFEQMLLLRMKEMSETEVPSVRLIISASATKKMRERKTPHIYIRPMNAGSLVATAKCLSACPLVTHCRKMSASCASIVESARLLTWERNSATDLLM